MAAARRASSVLEPSEGCATALPRSGGTEGTGGPTGAGEICAARDSDGDPAGATGGVEGLRDGGGAGASAGGGTICRLIRSPSKPVTMTLMCSPGTSDGGSAAATRSPPTSSRSVNPLDGKTVAATTSPGANRDASVRASAASALSSCAICAAISAGGPPPRG